MSRLAGPLALLWLGSILFLAVGPARNRRLSSRADRRACFGTQKALADAVEALALETKVPVAQLDAALLARLKRDGFMATIPDDPGFGAGTADHYILVPEAPAGIACLHHGLVGEGSEACVYQQLVDAGVTDPGLLARASRYPTWADRWTTRVTVWMATGPQARVFEVLADGAFVVAAAGALPALALGWVLGPMFGLLVLLALAAWAVKIAAEWAGAGRGKATG